MLAKPVRVVRTPAPYKDLNEWLKSLPESLPGPDPFVEALRAAEPDLPERPALRRLQGASPVAYARRKISEEATLLGKRYLCRGGGCSPLRPPARAKAC